MYRPIAADYRLYVRLIVVSFAVLLVGPLDGFSIFSSLVVIIIFYVLLYYYLANYINYLSQHTHSR